jgi:hypothetical protein
VSWAIECLVQEKSFTARQREVMLQLCQCLVQ